MGSTSEECAVCEGALMSEADKTQETGVTGKGPACGHKALVCRGQGRARMS